MEGEELPKYFGFKELRDALTAQSIIYPFMDELRILAEHEVVGVDPMSLPENNEFRKYAQSMKEGAKYFVATAINLGNILPKYAGMMSVHMLPTIGVCLHKMEKGDANTIKSYAKVMLKSENLSTFDKEKHLYQDLAADKFRELEDDGLLDSETYYYTLSDDKLAYFLTGKTGIVAAANASFDVHKYISSTFLPPLDFAGNIKPTIIPVQLKFTDDTSHATAIFIQPATGLSAGRGENEAFFFEPHVDAPWSRRLDKTLSSLLKSMFQKFGIRYTSLVKQSCPMGLQSAMVGDHGSCQTWNLMAMLMCALNPGMPKKELFGKLIGLGDIAVMALNIFIYHIYSLFDMGKTNPIEPFLGLDETIDHSVRMFRAVINRLLQNHSDNKVAAELLMALKPKRSWVWCSFAQALNCTNIPSKVDEFLQLLVSDFAVDDLWQLMHKNNIFEYIEMEKFMPVLYKLFPPPAHNDDTTH